MIRRDLTPAQRAKLTAQRKAAYEATHPETKNGATGRGRTKVSQVGKANDSFTVETAAKSGRSKTAIARDVTRGKARGAKAGMVVRYQNFLNAKKMAMLEAIARRR